MILASLASADFYSYQDHVCFWKSSNFIKIGNQFQGSLNPLSANPIKWSNALKHFFGNLLTKCLSGFDHFMRFVLKGLKTWNGKIYIGWYHNRECGIYWSVRIAFLLTFLHFFRNLLGKCSSFAYHLSLVLLIIDDYCKKLHSTSDWTFGGSLSKSRNFDSNN